MWVLFETGSRLITGGSHRTQNQTDMHGGLIVSTSPGKSLQFGHRPGGHGRTAVAVQLSYFQGFGKCFISAWKTGKPTTNHFMRNTTHARYAMAHLTGVVFTGLVT